MARYPFGNDADHVKEDNQTICSIQDPCPARLHAQNREGTVIPLKAGENADSRGSG